MKEDIRELYRLFELEPGASLEALKQAYHILVQVWHPDRFTANSKIYAIAQDKLQKINAAYFQLRQLAQQSARSQNRTHPDAATPPIRPQTQKKSSTSKNPGASFKPFTPRTYTQGAGGAARPVPTSRNTDDFAHKQGQTQGSGKKPLVAADAPEEKRDQIRLYRRAAEQGFESAQFQLGLHYFLGDGVPQDDIEAYKWFELTLQKNGREKMKALAYRARLMARMTAEQFALGQDRVAAFLVKIANA